MSNIMRFSHFPFIRIFVLFSISLSTFANTASYTQSWVSKSSPIENESVVYTIRLLTQLPLSRVELTLPKSGQFTLKELDGPITATKVINGISYITNDFHYLLSVKGTGTLEITPAHIVALPAYQPIWPTEDEALPVNMQSNPVVMTIKPTPEAQKQQVAVSSLHLNAQWLKQGNAQQPYELEVKTVAFGALGNQLPSVLPHLKSKDFNVKRLDSRTTWQVSSEGRRLEGQKTETFAIEPTHQGNINIPDLQVRWWNVNKNREEQTAIPVEGIKTGDAALANLPEVEYSPLTDRIHSDHAIRYFLLPLSLGLLIAFLIGRWVCRVRVN